MKFAEKYPLLNNVLECYVRPGIETRNLFITVHFVMKDSPAEMCAGLKGELDAVVLDAEMADADILAEFCTEIPEAEQIMNSGNVRPLLATLREYVHYLYDVEGFQGASKWTKTEA